MSGQPPWHLWGNTQTLTIPGFTIPGGGAGADVVAPIQQGQLCKVSYHRPDTFHFLFASQIVSGLDANADTTVIVSVDFDVIVGIGRSQISMPTFEEHSWSWTNLPVPVGDQCRTTSVKGRRQFIEGSSIETTLIDEITAEDIQLSASLRMEVTIAAPGPDLVIPDTAVIVSAQFAPKTHIRPEWFLEHFPGHEQGNAPDKPQPVVHVQASPHLPPGRIVTRTPGGR